MLSSFVGVWSRLTNFLEVGHDKVLHEVANQLPARLLTEDRGIDAQAVCSHKAL